MAKSEKKEKDSSHFLSKSDLEDRAKYADKKITKVVRDNKDISHIEFVDKKKGKKGYIFYDCSVAGITPVSSGGGGFYKIKNKAYCESDASGALASSSTAYNYLEKPAEIKKDYLTPLSKKERCSVVNFIKSNLKHNADIMNEETFECLSRIIDNIEFEDFINEEVIINEKD